MATVTVMVREGCGSCVRVVGQVRPVAERWGAELAVVDVDAGDGAAAIEFGDRVPVVLVDGEEIACWEIDEDELEDALRGIE